MNDDEYGDRLERELIRLLGRKTYLRHALTLSENAPDAAYVGTPEQVAANLVVFHRLGLKS